MNFDDSKFTAASSRYRASKANRPRTDRVPPGRLSIDGGKNGPAVEERQSPVEGARAAVGGASVCRSLRSCQRAECGGAGIVEKVIGVVDVEIHDVYWRTIRVQVGRRIERSARPGNRRNYCPHTQ